MQKDYIVEEYKSSNPHREVFLDYAVAGFADGEEFGGAVALTDTVMEGLKNQVRGCLGRGTLGYLGLKKPLWIEGADEKGFKFELEVRGESIKYWITNSGARGKYLNAVWNPTRLLTGQNVFRASRDEVNVEGIDLKLMPDDVFAFPFKLLSQEMNREFGVEKWVGAKLIDYAIRNKTIYWRRFDITTYTGKFEDEQIMRSCLEMIDFMASSKMVLGFDMRDKRKQVTRSLEEFVKAKFESYKTDGKFETVSFVKTWGVRKQAAYRLTLYDKSAEVAASKNPGNEKALAKDGRDLKNRLRIELQLYPSSFHQIRTFSKLVGKFDGKWATTAALSAMFPSLADFQEKKGQLIVAALKDLHLDYLLFPRNPFRLLSKAAEFPEDPVSVVLKAWEKLSEKPLPGKNELLKHVEGLTRKQAMAALNSARDAGLDLTKISFAEAALFWTTFVNAHMDPDKYKQIEKNNQLRMEKDLSDKKRLQMQKYFDDALREARSRALVSRGSIASRLRVEAIASNLTQGKTV
jgi:hypothetical protein